MPYPHLPLELWHQVAGLLCYHCTRNSSHGTVLDDRLDWTKFYPLTTSLDILARLCRVSRALNTIVTPALYHAPITMKAAMLLRTLFDRPDQTRYVRELQNGMWNDWNSVQRYEYPPLFLELYEYNVERLLQHRDDVLTPGGWELEELINPDELEGHMLDSTAIALRPKLTALHVGSIYRHVCFTVTPNALMSLTCAAVVHEGVELAVGPDTVTHLASATPNLTVLYLRTARIDADEDITYPLLPCVTDLTLDDSLIAGVSFRRTPGERLGEWAR